jgi:hypothetical protein
MTGYMITAGKANKVAQRLIELIPEQSRPAAAALMAQLVNLGVRCNPRPAHGTIRLNSVREAMKGLPVSVSMTEVKDEKTGKTFKALSATPKGETAAVTEEADSAD